MSRALAVIEKDRIAFTQEALKKKPSEIAACDRKKLVKRNKLKRTDPIEHDNTQLEVKSEVNQNEEKKAGQLSAKKSKEAAVLELSLIHICRCRRIERCRSRWAPYQ
eukprot:TRINITY_DN15773_c0_g1_i1.p2 TRINITY_DN15773_c0_g1~~TRINITY_DN15773_c0_g1_i1.p2  ORF type:complete len:107 (+),score=28.43 TRINITY_DN15773_c0_g1_i1:425-745(+)